MRKTTVILFTVLLSALLLSACGPRQTTDFHRRHYLEILQKQGYTNVKIIDRGVRLCESDEVQVDYEAVSRRGKAEIDTLCNGMKWDVR